MDELFITTAASSDAGPNFSHAGDLYRVKIPGCKGVVRFAFGP